MKKRLLFLFPLAVVAFVLHFWSCDKERIVESSEIVREVEYINIVDTVTLIDTVVVGDSIIVKTIDTVEVSDTVAFIDTIAVIDTIETLDTVVQIQWRYDTVTVVQHHHDTTIVHDIDTVVAWNPSELLGVSAMHYHADPVILEFIYQEFGLDDGWIFYLSTFQLGFASQGVGVYDYYGYIDYWTPDWSSYYPLEFGWRLTYTGGDPDDPNNWQMTDAPELSKSASPGRSGISLRTTSELGSQRILK